jgi:GTP-binding protein
MKILNAKFIKSCTTLENCPADNKPEFAFIGRSNVGKSSLINLLTNNKNMAKTSQKPGKTQLINHFLINDSWYLVDLPGYGYAKTSKTLRETFDVMIKEYLKKRENMYCVFVLVDSNIPPQQKDLEFLTWLGKNEVPFALVFTKADRLTLNKLNASIAAFKKEMLREWEFIPEHFITSSVSSLGKEEILGFIDSVLNQA